MVLDVPREDTPHGFHDRVHDQIALATVQVARDFNVPVACRQKGYPQGPAVFGTQTDPFGVQDLAPLQRRVLSVDGQVEGDLIEVKIPQG